jgi:DNA-binding GntR family transcriptional regulator
VSGAGSGASLREEAIRALRAAIVYGELEPGRLHSAPALAARMGMSVTPVREAVLELVSRGMVTPVRNRGFTVVRAGAAELDATLQLRMLLEVPAIGRLAGRLDDGAARAASELAEDCVQAAHAADLTAFLDLYRRFHLCLLEAYGNARLATLVDRLRDRLRFEGFREAGGRVTLADVAEGHRSILAAVLAGGPDEAEAAMREHLLLTRSVWAQDQLR